MCEVIIIVPALGGILEHAFLIFTPLHFGQLNLYERKLSPPKMSWKRQKKKDLSLRLKESREGANLMSIRKSINQSGILFHKIVILLKKKSRKCEVRVPFVLK